MTTSTAYKIAYGSTVIAATLAASLMAGNAMAEGPIVIESSTPFTSTRSRADVRAEVLEPRGAVSAAHTEWALQHPMMQADAGGRTRAQARSEYIGARDEVRAFNGEDSGSAFTGQRARRSGNTQMAGSALR
jgi:hypothetical protein